MKKIMYAIMFLLLISSVFGVSILGVSTNYMNPTSRDIKISLVNQEPDPVDPGGNVKLRFKVENYGTITAENLTVKIEPELPLKTYGEAETRINSLTGLQMGNDKVIVTFNLKTDAGTPQTIGAVYVRYMAAGDDSWTRLGPYNVTIKNLDAIIGIEDFSILPGTISPGEVATISFKIRNTAQSVLSDMKVTLDLEATTIPFVPDSGTNQKSIGKLNSMQARELSFKVRALPDAGASAYKIPLKITYHDDLGRNYTTTSLIGLVVGDTPDVMLSIESTTLLTKKEAGELAIQIVNRGLTNIKFMTIEAVETDDYKVLTNKIVYLGKIESDDYETAKYTLYINGDKTDVPIKFKLSYKDTNNNEYTAEDDVVLHMYTPSEMNKYGLASKQSYAWVFILVLIVAGIGYYIWRKKKKEARK